MKLDILCFGAHPDDVELAMSGTIIKHVSNGLKVGVVDITRGELGSRGTAETRDQEASNASKILGLSVRDNLGLADGFFENNKDAQIKVVESLRKYQPDVVFCNAPSDRHPDHGKASKLVSVSCFLSGLIKVETFVDGNKQEKWRPKRVFKYVQDNYLEPDFVIDVTSFYKQRTEAILAYETQFYKPEMTGVQTPISSP